MADNAVWIEHAAGGFTYTDDETVTAPPGIRQVAPFGGVCGRRWNHGPFEMTVLI